LKPTAIQPFYYEKSMMLTAIASHSTYETGMIFMQLSIYGR